MTRDDFGREITRRRVGMGLTQEELAVAAGVSRGTVRNAEAGKVLTERARDLLSDALDRAERGRLGDLQQAARPSPPGPCLLYVGADGSQHAIDVEDWDPAVLPERERALYDALVAYTLKRLGGAS